MSTKKIYSTKEEIINLLERVLKNQSHLEFTQDQETIIKASWSLVKNINYHTYDFAIRPEDHTNQFNFKNDLPLYVSNEGKTVQFQTKLRSDNKKNLIFVEIPEELSLIDTRTAQRYEFEAYDIDLVYKNLSVIKYNLKHKLITAQLCDISENGISFTSENKTDPMEYHLGDKILFQTINGYSSQVQMVGRIVYMKDHKDFKKFGVKFDRKIPIDTVLKYLNNQSYIQVKS